MSENREASDRAIVADLRRASGRYPGDVRLAALIRRSAICLSNDSGPMHIAVALGRAVVSVFGPTDPVWAGPYHRGGAVVQVSPPCSPCYLRQLSRCTHDHACMHEVSAQAVIARAENILGKRGGNATTPKTQAVRR